MVNNGIIDGFIHHNHMKWHLQALKIPAYLLPLLWCSDFFCFRIPPSSWDGAISRDVGLLGLLMLWMEIHWDHNRWRIWPDFHLVRKTAVETPRSQQEKGDKHENEKKTLLRIRPVREAGLVYRFQLPRNRLVVLRLSQGLSILSAPWRGDFSQVSTDALHGWPRKIM